MSSEPTKRSDRREARYTYDQADRRTTMTLPGGEVVAYGYEDDPNYFDGRVRSIYADDANYPFPTVYY